MAAVIQHKFLFHHPGQGVHGRQLGDAELTMVQATPPESLIQRDVLCLQHGLQARSQGPVFAVLFGRDDLRRSKISGLVRLQVIRLLLLVPRMKSDGQEQKGDHGLTQVIHVQAQCTAVRRQKNIELFCRGYYFAKMARALRNRPSKDSLGVLPRRAKVLSANGRGYPKLTRAETTSSSIGEAVAVA